jgi:hypothetical protein
MNRLPLETQTLYAELVEQLTVLEARRAIGHLPGCFTIKTVKGLDYYYYQHSDPGGVMRQIYIGRKTPELWPYVQFCRDLSMRTGLDMRTLDRALWQYSKEKQKVS